MAKGGKGGASKNNAALREKARKIFFNGIEVKPVLVLWNGRKYMAVQYDDNSGKMAYDTSGEPLAWGNLGSGDTASDTAAPAA
jgi:hypothetical protein